MLKLSTGYRNGILGTSSAKALLDGGFIKLYAGATPTTADDALGGATLLATFSVNGGGTGLTFDAPSNGILPKNPAETWSCTAVATGTPTFFRFVTPTDDGSTSTVFPRLQGSVGQVGFDLNLSNTSLVSGQAVNPIQAFAINQVTL